MFKTPLIAITLLSPANCADIVVGECRHEEPRQATISTAGVTEVVIKARAGLLRVEGSSSASEIQIDGLACASRRSDLDRIELVAEKRGHKAFIEARIDTGRRYRNEKLDLEIVVPEDLPLTIEDGSGRTEIRGVAAVEIDDQSGEIFIEGVAGDVRVEDGSGDVTLIDIGGEVRIGDGSGDVRIRNAGSVVVDDDGSGDLEIEEIEGDVEVRDDGSGDIEVFDVGGDLTIRDSGSGDVDYEDIKGRVDVR